MSVYTSLSDSDRPDWSDVTGAGQFRVEPGGWFDCHFHDFDEYWFVTKGAALISVGTERHVIHPGDIVCTERGTEHDVIEVYEDLEAFYFEGPLPEGGRGGHLHRGPEDAAGHRVGSGEEPTGS